MKDVQIKTILFALGNRWVESCCKKIKDEDPEIIFLRGGA